MTGEPLARMLKTFRVPKKRCQTCYWWCYSPGDEWGHCSAANSLMRAYDPGRCCWPHFSIETHQTFGCVMWKEKGNE